MKPTLFCVVAAIALTLGSIAKAAGPHNIFDEDWTPPKSADVARPAPPPPASPVADPARPIDPSKAPSEIQAPAPIPVVRQSVPAKAQQAAARKVLKDVFSDQLADRSIPARKKLTEALLEQARKSADAPVDQFVLLAAAIEAAGDAVNLPLAFQAGNGMAEAFDVDGLAIKADSVIRLSPKPESGDAAAKNVRAGLQLVDELLEAERFISANRVCAALLPIAASNQTLRTEVLNRQREVTANHEASDKVVAHLKKLETSPDDAVANLEVGKYLCFYRHAWNAGLPALSRGGDASLKSLASKELAGAKTADAQAALGDGWWDIAQTSPPAGKAAIEAHAADWYRRAAGDLKGLSKARVDKRLASLASRNPGETWVILFCSSNPRIWGTEADHGKNNFALKPTAAPQDIKWLRLTCPSIGRSVVIPMTNNALVARTLVSEEFGWDGTGEFMLDAAHLGIWSEKLTLDHPGVVAVSRAGHDRRGWGFGRHHAVDKGQGCSWQGEELKGPLVFEIAVKGGTLTSAEQKQLLTAP